MKNSIKQSKKAAAIKKKFHCLHKIIELESPQETQAVYGDDLL